MNEKGQYDESYTVNGETVFDKSKKELEKILDGFPNKSTLANLVLKPNGLCSIFYCFIITKVFTF